MAPCAIALMLVTAASADDEASAVFGIKLPTGYRDWQLITVAHEAGDLNDLRAVLGNDIAMKAFRDGTRPFPDGAIIGRLAWQYVPSAEDNAIFGRVQSFVPGPATNVQFSVKDSKKYADTGGWGFGQFQDGRPNRSEVLMKTCFPCHNRAPKADDFVFSHYAP
jgi:hypothetical protein